MINDANTFMVVFVIGAIIIGGFVSFVDFPLWGTKRAA